MCHGHLRIRSTSAHTYISRSLRESNPDVIITRGGGEKRAHPLSHKKKRTPGLWKEEKEGKTKGAKRTTKLFVEIWERVSILFYLVQSHDGGTLTQEFKCMYFNYFEYKRNGWDAYSSRGRMA